MNQRKKILLLLPTGMTVRNILTTPTVENILKSDNIEIICCVNNPEKYGKYLIHRNIIYDNFYKRNVNNFSSFLLLILGSRFEYINENISIKILKSGPIGKKRSKFFSYVLAFPFPQSKSIYNFFLSMLKFFYQPNKSIELQFKLYKPDLVFATNIVTKDEFDYIAAAKRNNIPVVGMVKSFDNLTTKGFLPYLPEYAILWNEVMKKELISIYQFKKNNIYVTGVPQFDIYKEKPTITKNQFFKKYNLPENKKLILFSTNHHSLSPDDPLNIEYIAHKLDELNANLLVRVHPNDTPKRYLHLNFKNVFIYSPGILEGIDSSSRVAQKSFLEDIRDNIFFSDVTINTCSTMTLDASAINKPIINLAFDYDEKPYHKSVTRYYDLKHYKPIIDTKSTSLAYNKQELISLISYYFKSPSMKEIERKKLNEIMLANNDGSACLNVAEAIHDIIKSIV